MNKRDKIKVLVSAIEKSAIISIADLRVMLDCTDKYARDDHFYKEVVEKACDYIQNTLNRKCKSEKKDKSVEFTLQSQLKLSYLLKREKKKEAIPTEFKTFNDRMGGIRLGMYYLIAADSGSYKTTLVDNLMMNLWLKDNSLKFLYFSFEIDTERKHSNWLSYFIYQNSKIRINNNKIFNNDLSEVEQEICNNNSLAKLFIEEHVTMIDEVKNMDQIEQIIKDNLENSDNLIVILDHISLIDVMPKETLKSNIDKLSSKFVNLRNTYKEKITFFIVQQFNGELESNTMKNRMYNQKAMYDQPEPGRKDLADSKYTYRDADYVFFLINPAKYNMEKCNKVLIKNGMENYMIIMTTDKARYGVSKKNIILRAEPSIGDFIDISGDIEDNIKLNEHYAFVAKLEKL